MPEKDIYRKFSRTDGERSTPETGRRRYARKAERDRESSETPALCRKIDREDSTHRLHDAKIHWTRASLVFLAPPSLQKTPPAARRASSARWITAWLVVSIPPIALSARSGASGANTALNRSHSRSHSRSVIVRVGIGGTSAGCEEWVGWRTGVTPGPRAGGASICPWVSGSARARGVLADTVLQVRARRAVGAEEVDSAAGGGTVGGTDHWEGVAEDVADVEVAGRVRFEDRAHGMGLAVGAHVGYADLAVEAGSEVCATGCRTGVGAAVERVVGTLSVTGPGDGEAVRLSITSTVGDGKDAEGCC